MSKCQQVWLTILHVLPSQLPNKQQSFLPRDAPITFLPLRSSHLILSIVQYRIRIRYFGNAAKREKPPAIPWVGGGVGGLYYRNRCICLC